MTATASASAAGHVVSRCESDRSEDYPTLYHASSSVLSHATHRHATTTRVSSSRADTAVLSQHAGSVGDVSSPLPHNDRSMTSDSYAANTRSVVQHTTTHTTTATSSSIISAHTDNNSSAASPSAMRQRGTNVSQGVVTISGTITTTRAPPTYHTPSLTTTTTTTRRSNTIAVSHQQQQQSDVVQQRSMMSEWVRLPDGHYMEPYTTSLYDNDNTLSPFTGYGSNRSSGSSGYDSRNRRNSHSGHGLASVTAERGCVVCLHYRTEARSPDNNNSNNASGVTRHTPLRRVFVRHMPLEAWNALKAQGQLRHIPHHSRTHNNTSNSGFAGYSVYRSSRHHFMPSTEHLVLPRQTSTMPRSFTPHTTTTTNSNNSVGANAGRVMSSEMTTASNAHESAGSRVRRAFSQLIARHTTSTLSRLSITTYSSHNNSTNMASLLRRSSSPSSSLHPSLALRHAGHGAGRQADTHNRSIHHTHSDDRSETHRSVSYTNGAAAGTGLSEAARRMRSEALNNNNSEYYTTTTTNDNGEEEEPAVHDYVVLPGSRAQALRLFKHSSLLHYLQYKWMCSQQVQRLRRIEREDRRALLALERRQTFLRCLQRDEEGRRNGTLLYVVGRELPQEMVQLFFLLNEQFVPRRRQREEQQRRQESLTTTTTTPSSTTTTTTGGEEEGGRNRNNETRSEQDVQQQQQRGHHRRLDGDSQRTHSDFFALDALNTRWGDRLLFAGLRPVEGYVVVTVSEANMNRTADHDNSGSTHAVEEDDDESSSSSSEGDEYDNGRVTRARRGGGGVWETYAYTPRPETEKEQHIS